MTLLQEPQSPQSPLDGSAAQLMREDGTGQLAAQVEKWRRSAVYSKVFS